MLKDLTISVAIEFHRRENELLNYDAVASEAYT